MASRPAVYLESDWVPIMKPESKRPPSSDKTEADGVDAAAGVSAAGKDADAPKDGTVRPAFDATVALDPVLVRSTKEERDVTFAIAAMQSDQVNARQVTRALENWTIHGHRSLADHLVNQGVIGPDDRTQLEKVAVAMLSECSAATAGDLQSCLRDKVGADNWERICRMLGVMTTTEGAETDAPRETLAEYVIVRRLGMGGLGSVWLARDKTLNRLVALKEVNERGSESPATVARFRREAEITGQLEHPNIVPVYQSGQDTKTKQPFYVMRFVGKKTLADAISDYHARRAAGLADTVELHRLLGAFLSVCQAVAFAHSRNVLHRDLKPENVALGNFGQVIVLDWGLAKRTDDGDWQDTVVTGGPGSSTVERTVAGQVLGTPHYMSPEQAAGRVDSMDERTDVYGLGATLFAILTGYAPHEASQVGSTRSARGAELYAAIVDNPTPRCRATVPESPAPLDAICARAMAAAPAARYPSAAELAEDIQLWIAGEPVSAYTEPWTSRLSRSLRKHRALSVLLFAILLAVVVPLGFLAYSSNERRAAAQQARMEALYLDGKGLSVNLEAAADKGRQNVRFMSRIPPIQGIIRAGQPDSSEEDDEEIWRGRLETIYAGLLRANPAYLSISYVALGEDAREVVRVERNRFDRTSIEAVAAARMKALPEDAPQHGVATLNSGDVALSDLLAADGDRSQVAEALGPQPLTLHLVVPIFDETTGELFGPVSLDVDLEYLLTEWARDTAAESVLLVDRTGRVMAVFEPDKGRDFGWRADAASALLPASFVEGRETELKVPPSDEHPGGLYAIKVPLDPRRPENVVILVVRGG